MRTEFSWTPEEVQRSEKFGTLAAELLTDMHEVIGHASGQQAAGFKGTPQEAIKEHFSALEEGRADLIGLYFIGDPKLVELGIVPAADQEAIMRAEYEAYTRNAIVQLRRVREGTQIEEDHMRNRQMIVRWLMANTKSIEQRTRDNKTYLVVTDAKAFRDGVGKLLAEVQRIKSEGDYAAAKTLFETHGIHFDADAARRDRQARGQPEPAVIPGIRHAQADGGEGTGRHDHRRPDLLPDGPDEADAGVRRRRAEPGGQRLKVSGPAAPSDCSLRVPAAAGSRRHSPRARAGRPPTRSDK